MQDLEVDTLENGQDEIAIFTDGLQHLVLRYDQQTVHGPFFERMLRPVRQSSVLGEDRRLGDELKAYLGSETISTRTDDDLTLLMASRRTGQVDVDSAP
jgi:hypothetical protein